MTTHKLSTNVAQHTTPKISHREQQVLSLLAEGNSRKMIAAELNLKNETIHSYFKNIYRKLEVNSATQALRKISTDHKFSTLQ
jgi:DNA-binding NarL/FixJ family response regulator